MMTRSRKPVGEQSTAGPHERFEIALVRGITLLAAWSRGERARRQKRAFSALGAMDIYAACPTARRGEPGIC
jgi:hypothetical protein